MSIIKLAGVVGGLGMQLFYFFRFLTKHVTEAFVNFKMFFYFKNFCVNERFDVPVKKYFLK